MTLRALGRRTRLHCRYLGSGSVSQQNSSSFYETQGADRKYGWTGYPCNTGYGYICQLPPSAFACHPPPSPPAPPPLPPSPPSPPLPPNCGYCSHLLMQACTYPTCWLCWWPCMRALAHMCVAAAAWLSMAQTTPC